MQEFLQAEKSTLQEALKEGEQEIKRMQEQIRSLETNRLEVLLVPASLGQSENVGEAESNLTLSPGPLAGRSPQFPITPTENLDKSEILSDFSKAMMTTSTGSDSM